jgi:hypothetical protein
VISEDVNWTLEFVRVSAGFVAAGIGAWLSIRFLPLKAKKDEWIWKKNIETLEFLFNSLSKIHFVAENHIYSEYAGKVSMAKLTHNESEELIFSLVRELHKQSAGMTLVLSKAQNKVLSGYLNKSQKILDEASASWNEWSEGDQEAIIEHSNTTLSNLGSQADKSLQKLKKTTKKMYNA